jgi:hypothetical protein
VRKTWAKKWSHAAAMDIHKPVVAKSLQGALSCRLHRTEGNNHCGPPEGPLAPRGRRSPPAKKRFTGKAAKSASMRYVGTTAGAATTPLVRKGSKAAAASRAHAIRGANIIR